MKIDRKHFVLPDGKVQMPTRGDAGRFSLRYTRREMREFMERQGDMALSVEGLLCQRDDGECFG